MFNESSLPVIGLDYAMARLWRRVQEPLVRASQHLVPEFKHTIYDQFGRVLSLVPWWDEGAPASDWSAREITVPMELADLGPVLWPSR